MKKFDHIVFYGDSWTEANNTDGIWPRPITIEETFPYMVAEEYNVSYTKVSKGGANNGWIHRQIYNTLPKIAQKYKKVLSITGWSSPARVELPCLNKLDWEGVASPPFSLEFFKHYMIDSYMQGHPVYDVHTITLIKSARALYKCLDVDYIDAFAFTPILYVDFLDSCNMLDTTYHDIVGLGEGRLYNKETGIYWHQTPIGNRMIADALIRHINQNNG